jgi:hypothetical protein
VPLSLDGIVIITLAVGAAGAHNNSTTQLRGYTVHPALLWFLLWVPLRKCSFTHTHIHALNLEIYREREHSTSKMQRQVEAI